MGKTNFADGDKSQGIPGTRLLAAFLNKIFTHRHDGLDQDGSAPIDYAIDSGTADAYVIALTPALTAHVAGMPISFKAANANTGASTLVVNGMTAKTIKKRGGLSLGAGDIKVGQIMTVVYDGTDFQLMGAGEFPSGTKMVFFQAAAPAGWTQVTTHNDKALRVVSGVGGGSGGTHGFSAAAANSAHTHTIAAESLADNLQFNQFTTGPVNAVNSITNHDHGGATGSAGGAWSPLYVDIIICSKD